MRFILKWTDSALEDMDLVVSNLKRNTGGVGMVW